MKSIAVVGAGPAGVTAAHLLALAGHHVEVFESHEHAGGRTRTVHFGEGHWLDTGAGWLTDFYPTAMSILRDNALDDHLTPLRLRGGGDLLLDGNRYPSPNSIGRILGSRLITWPEKIRFFAWMAMLVMRQRPNLRIDRRFDAQPAVQNLSSMGRGPLERVVRPSFEGPFFARLEQMNATLVRSWLRSLSIGSFFQVDRGMDRPWRDLAAELTVHYGATVTAAGGAGAARAWVEVGGERRSFDAVVLAAPAPVCATLLAADAPQQLAEVPYVPHVRVYAARHSTVPVPRSAIHVFPNEIVATVERGQGGDPAWGRVPTGWEWTLLCAPSASSDQLITLDDEELLDTMFSEASALSGERLEWRDHEIVHVVRWSHAVPVVDPNYYARIDALPDLGPIIFAGDWTDQPCVEGAVRSGVRAARRIDDSIPSRPEVDRR
ncbi:MAG: FAD-dependent oxidoreductase [Microcella sp.]|uniref:protoporphyrinogen/coproporphyrinogen oxidase n=1 Tax=Microcella sp. TaxID=1913979 RepID=UPI0024CBFCB0|nr:FAD-dependent oxidoreductase [Microcella sp.]UYN83859.1 MAG: FAD-dependent oxidoreductase [Microcella sp.]